MFKEKLKDPHVSYLSWNGSMFVLFWIYASAWGARCLPHQTQPLAKEWVIPPCWLSVIGGSGEQLSWGFFVHFNLKTKGIREQHSIIRGRSNPCNTPVSWGIGTKVLWRVNNNIMSVLESDSSTQLNSIWQDKYVWYLIDKWFVICCIRIGGGMILFSQVIGLGEAGEYVV